MLPGFYPISIGRGVSLAFNLFRFGWRTFVAINLVAIVPVAIVGAISAFLTYDAMAEWQQSLLTSPFTPGPTRPRGWRASHGRPSG